jgi:hypothetical protein
LVRLGETDHRGAKHGKYLEASPPMKIMASYYVFVPVEGGMIGC